MVGRCSWWIGILAAATLVPAVAFGQFGGLVKKSSFDTKPVEKLLKEIDGCVKQYDDATEKVWTATETVQDIVKQYREGEFPVLTKTWAQIRKDVTEAKDDAQRAAAVELSVAYVREIVERKKAVEEFLDDPVKCADLKSRIKAPELEQLNKIVANLKPVPQEDAAIATNAKDLTEKAGKSVVSLTEQTTKDPLKSGDYKKLIDRLNKGSEKMGKIMTDLDSQVKAVETTLTTLNKVIAP